MSATLRLQSAAGLLVTPPLGSSILHEEELPAAARRCLNVEGRTRRGTLVADCAALLLVW